MKPLLSDTVDVESSRCYLLECLESGCILSESVARELAIRQGRICVIIPENVNGTPPADPRHGDFCSRNEAVTALAAHLCDRVRLFGSAIIFEHSLARPGDAAVKRNPLPKLYLNNCVYFVAAHEIETDFDSMVQSIRSATTADAFRAFLLPKELLQESPSAKEGREQVKVLASAVESIIVGAFDNESFLIWQRQLLPTELTT